MSIATALEVTEKRIPCMPSRLRQRVKMTYDWTKGID